MMDSLYEDQRMGATAGVTRLVNQQRLLRNEYLAAENRILRAQLCKRLWLTDSKIYAASCERGT